MRARAVDHAKFKTAKIYSQDILVNYTKICTNENFPLYGNTWKWKSGENSGTITVLAVLQSMKFFDKFVSTHGYTLPSRA